MKKAAVCFLVSGFSLAFLISCAPLGELVRPSSQKTDRVCIYAPSLDSSTSFSELESSIVVEGSTLESLLRSLAVSNAGGRSDDVASTSWSVRWDFNWRAASTGCKITSAVANAKINYRFPVWPQQLNTSDRSLVSRWATYSDEFRARHCRYGEFGIQAAIEVERALKAISPRKGCERLQTDANELARDIVARYLKLDQQYRAQSLISPL